MCEVFARGGCQVEVRTRLAAAGDGYARIGVLQAGGGRVLGLEFVKAPHELRAAPQPRLWIKLSSVVLG